MSDFDHIDNNPPCFSPQNPVVDTTRIVFDVSNIPVGELQPLQPPDGETTPDTEEFLRRTLFPELSPLLPPFQEADPSTTHTIGNETNLVTIMTTTTLPPPPTNTMMLPTTKEEEQAAPTTQPHPVVRTRHRFWYAGKSFFATSVLYLQLNPSCPHPEATPDLVGVVAKCPTEKNGQQYTIRWKYPRLQGLQWPANLKHHLRTTFDKDFLHPGLKDWITSCPLNSRDDNPASNHDQDETMMPQQPAITRLAPRPNVANDPTPPRFLKSIRQNHHNVWHLLQYIRLVLRQGSRQQLVVSDIRIVATNFQVLLLFLPSRTLMMSLQHNSFLWL